jgi:hypothetical protein
MLFFFFEKEVETSDLCIEKLDYFNFIQQKTSKSIHQIIRSHQTTYTNPTMGEDHALRALCCIKT